MVFNNSKCYLAAQDNLKVSLCRKIVDESELLLSVSAGPFIYGPGFWCSKTGMLYKWSSLKKSHQNILSGSLFFSPMKKKSISEKGTIISFCRIFLEMKKKPKKSRFHICCWNFIMWLHWWIISPFPLLWKFYFYFYLVTLKVTRE